jgi:thioredoxin 1
MSEKAKMGIVLSLVIVVAIVAILKSNRHSAANPGIPAEVKAAETLPRLVDLGADKCIPCIKMEPILQELKEEYSDKFVVEFINVRKNFMAGQEHKIRLIPTQIFFDPTGNELYRHEGFFSKEGILAKWKELGFDFDESKDDGR